MSSGFFCPYCGRKIETADAVFCPYCAASLEGIFSEDVTSKGLEYEKVVTPARYLPPDVELASVGRRIAAILIDGIIVSFLVIFISLIVIGNEVGYGFFEIYFVFFMMLSPGYFLIFLIFAIIYSISFDDIGIFSFFGLIGPISLLYWILLEGINNGQTLGKMAVGIRVVKIDEMSGKISKCTMRASVVRNLLRIIDGLPGYYLIGLVSIADSDLKQRVGDRATKTIVVKD